MDVFIKAAEYMEIPVRRTDDEPLQKLLLLVRSELNLDLKNIKQEQAKFWKQHPALVKVCSCMAKPIEAFLFFFLLLGGQVSYSGLSLWANIFYIFFQTELLVQAQLTREFASLSPSLQSDFRRILETAPRLLEELMKVWHTISPYLSKYTLRC